jgi:hypothetical protein
MISDLSLLLWHDSWKTGISEARREGRIEYCSVKKRFIVKRQLKSKISRRKKN